MAEVRIHLSGNVDDLYLLSLLFPVGAYAGLEVISSITGLKDGLFDRVQDASNKETYVTGDAALPIIDALSFEEKEWVARELIAPVNGYASFADPNFKPVVPMSVSWKDAGHSGSAVFGSTETPPKPRLITATWSPLLSELRQSRVDYMVENPLAAYAASVIGGRPSWAEYYRLLEDIAGHRDTTLDKLAEAGLSSRQALDAFKKAANNRAFGRHGISKRDTSLPQEELMNLLEAREFVRNVVSTWLDIECGGRLPRNRVDGGPLRFGLDDRE